MSRLERSLLSDRLFEHNAAQYFGVQAIVTAIFEAVQLMAGGGGVTSKTSDAMKKYREKLLPSISDDKEERADKAKRILEREYEQGEFQIQALDYGKKPRKKRK